jgi:ABC-2 type transport system permease protein
LTPNISTKESRSVRIAHIFWHTYWGNIKRHSYLFFTFGFPMVVLGLPLTCGLIVVAVGYLDLPPTDSRPIGVVDQAGLFTNPALYPNDPVSVHFFDTDEAAAVALTTGKIQAYYEVGPTYWETGEIPLTYEQRTPNFEVRFMFEQWVRLQIESGVPPALLARLEQGPTIVHQGVTENERTFSKATLAEWALVYLVIYLVQLGGSFTAGYMFDSIASEANDRTLEIMISSVSPLQFLTGKLLGLLLVGITQLSVWGGGLLVLGVGASLLLEFDLLGFLLAWNHLGLVISVSLASYVMSQMFAAALGLMRVTGGAGTLLFNTTSWLASLTLFYATYVVPRNPHAPFTVAASLFPLTAPMVLLIRVVVSDVPIWQIILAQLILWGTNLCNILWLSLLLQANLVANTPPFSLRRWLKHRFTLPPAVRRK